MPRRNRNRKSVSAPITVKGRCNVVLLTLPTGIFGLTISPSSTINFFGYYTSKLAGIAQYYEFWRCVSLVLEFSPAFGNGTSVVHPVMIGYMPGLASATVTTLGEVVELPWSSPWLGGYTSGGVVSSITQVMRLRIPKKILRQPQISWFAQKSTSSIPPSEAYQGQLWGFEGNASVLGGDYINFVAEYEFQFKNPILPSIAPRKDPAMEMFAGTLKLEELTEEKLDNRENGSAENPRFTTSAVGVAKDAKAAHVPEDQNSSGSIESAVIV